MGHDHQQQSNSSSGAIVAVIVAVLLVAMLGLLVVGGATLFWVRSSAMQSREMLIEQRAIAETQRAHALAVQQKGGITATSDQRLYFEVSIDRDGTARVHGETIGRDELRAQLAKLKAETSNVFSVRINADADCPAKHVVTVLDVCDEVGDIDYRVAVSEVSALTGEKGG